MSRCRALGYTKDDVKYIKLHEEVKVSKPLTKRGECILCLVWVALKQWILQHGNVYVRY